MGGATASLLTQGTDTGDPTIYPNRVNGQVFFTVAGTDYSCSGSVVNTPARNTVLTAGHCINDPGTAELSSNLVFVPGYRDGSTPFGVWPATKLESPAGWVSSITGSGGNDDNEALDVGAFQVAANGAGQQIEDVLGAFGIGFDQSRNQTYTEYGYPGEFPYDGSKLYSISSPQVGEDTSFSPPTIEIQSDFTAGASGGPYVVDPGPTVLSEDTYGYLGDPEHNYGPFFGDSIKSFYETVAGIFEFTGVTRNKRKGTASLSIHVPDAGSLALSGAGVKPQQKQAGGPGTVNMPVIPRARPRLRLRRHGRLIVTLEVAFAPQNGAPNSETKSIKLVQRRR